MIITMIIMMIMTMIMMMIMMIMTMMMMSGFFLLDRYCGLDLFMENSRESYSAGRHVVPLRYIFFLTLCSYSLVLRASQKLCKYTFHSLWFYTIYRNSTPDKFRLQQKNEHKMNLVRNFANQRTTKTPLTTYKNSLKIPRG